MLVENIEYQYPEENIRVKNYNHTVIPNKNDITIRNDKKYIVDYRIFAADHNGTITIVLKEVE